MTCAYPSAGELIRVRSYNIGARRDVFARSKAIFNATKRDITMKKFIASFVVGAFLLLASQASNAEIITSSSSLIMDSSSQNIVWQCKVTQTLALADNIQYPGGKAGDCSFMGTQVSFNWCTTNASAGHTCTTSTNQGPAYAGSYYFVAIALGYTSGGWQQRGVTPRGLNCSVDYSCTSI